MRPLHPRIALALVACSSALGCATSGDENLDTSGQPVTLSPNAHAAYDYFVGKGLSTCQAAGIVGNLEQESSIDPTIKQYGGGPGRGIAQWSAGGRWDHDASDNVAWYAQQHGQSEWSLSLQLDFTWYELETFSHYGRASLVGSHDLTSATVAFQTDFEACGTCDETRRIQYAQAALGQFGGGRCSGGGGSSSGGGSGGGSGSGSGGGGTPSPLVGHYTCSTWTSANVTQPPIGNDSGGGSADLTIGQSGSTLTADISGSAGVSCSLHLNPSGSTASLVAGEHCTANGTLVAAVTGGHASLSGNQLKTTIDFDLSGTESGVTVVGTGTETATCTKM